MGTFLGFFESWTFLKLWDSIHILLKRLWDSIHISLKKLWDSDKNSIFAAETKWKFWGKWEQVTHLADRKRKTQLRNRFYPFARKQDLSRRSEIIRIQNPCLAWCIQGQVFKSNRTKLSCLHKRLAERQWHLYGACVYDHVSLTRNYSKTTSLVALNKNTYLTKSFFSQNLYHFPKKLYLCSPFRITNLV